MSLDHCRAPSESSAPRIFTEDMSMLREANAKAGSELGALMMMPQSLDYVKPREADAKAEPKPEIIQMMSESLDYVKPREADAEADLEPGSIQMMSESLDYVKCEPR
ncbi:hypothetical protein HO173_002471 [Letharia columbiana]|uniref:Uncharacterized protein n=1 Tax=Letharia columbiana TaxID=112416 RepID=A0A8H6G285_9LECA|nr:uncharacterized protein HO173_002471 [Letharia columbiana]KAF6239210.1 hypothetical protein HO173_002471 [Letharia columbiana]